MERKRSNSHLERWTDVIQQMPLRDGESRLQQYKREKRKEQDRRGKLKPTLQKKEVVAQIKSTGIAKGHFIERGDILVSDVLQYMLECFCDWEKFEECCSYREPQTHMIVHRRNGQRFMVKVEIIPRGKKYPRP
jgi:hypothetical protein